MNKFILTIAASLLGLVAFSQENQIWYFGNAFSSAEGISFNSGSPEPRNGECAITVYESITVQSKQDTLQFYSDGHNVYDKNHHIMPNGADLIGTQGSAKGTAVQGASSFLLPGSNSTYLMFNNAATDGATEGIRWTEIDMELTGNGTLNNPCGDVTSNKDISLTPGKSVTEMLGVLVVSCDEYWVVGHEKNSDNFISIKVTENGPQTAIYSASGPTVTSYGARGSIKISPDGTKLIMAGGFPTYINVFDFDKNTGLVSNVLKVPKANDIDYGYGAEWSPNSKYVYYSSYAGQPGINGYNTETNTSFIVNDTLAIGDLQMAPDGKIYCVPNSQLGNTLATISNPNDGESAIFDANAYTMTTAVGNMGLPASYSCESTTNTTSPNTNISHLKLKQNPVQDNLVFSIKGNSTVAYQVSIVSITGNIVLSTTIIPNLGEIKLNISSLQSGNYLLRVLSQGKNVGSKKFIKLN